jgi:Ca-activated chloride channel family protein
MTALPLVLMTEEEVAGLGRVEGGFGALRTDRGLLPLTALDVDVRVAGVIASIEVAQTFVNTTGTPVEATYIFPLPDRAAVNRFRMEVAGRVIEGVLDERGAAREQYEQAIAAGHRAAITEEERPGVFTLRVGNLMPGEAATVRLSLVGPLPIDDGEVTFRFPLVVAPRYMPGLGLGGDQAGLGTAEDTSLVPDASRISPPVLLPGCPNPVRLGLRVALEDTRLSGVVSSLHAVTSSLRDAHVVEVQPGERLDRDFILRWRIDGGELRSTLVCADDADGRAGSFMLTLVPPSTTTMAAKPRDVVFVIDRSGSMSGWKMIAARRAAARMIDSLTSRDRFCAIAFDTTIEIMPDAQLVTATDRNRFRAVEALAQVESRGGTEMAEPLRRAATMLAGGHDDRERVIVLVTDGQVGNEDHILREMTPNLRNVRMFTLGIDQAVNAAFLRRLASAGGGLCELVESEDRLDEVMAKVHRRIGTPIATELQVDAIGLDVDRATLAPTKLPDVYAGAPVVILGRYRGAAPADARIELRGTSLGEAMHVAVARERELERGTWLAASWARAHIRELEDRYAAGARELDDRIVRVSKTFGVLSRFTAFVAVDRSQIANAGGHLHQVVQPVDLPAGWDKSGGPGGGGMPAKTKAGWVTNAYAPMQAMPAPMMPAGGPLVAGRSGPPVQAGPMRAEARSRSIEPRDALSAPPPPPAAPMAAPSGRPPPPRPSEAAPSSVIQATADATAYLAKLGVLARELEHHATLGSPASVIRLVRQRLTEWVEDLRSVGGHDALAAAVEQLVQRLSAVLASSTDLPTQVAAIATELGRIAGGAPPPKQGRAFWK